jgi:hypothetical protein
LTGFTSNRELKEVQMSKWLRLTDAGNPSKVYNVQATNIGYVTSRIEGKIRSEVCVQGVILQVAQLANDILGALKETAEAVAETPEE